MRVVFSKLQNCPGFNDGDFRDGGSAFQHIVQGTKLTDNVNIDKLGPHAINGPYPQVGLYNAQTN